MHIALPYCSISQHNKTVWTVKYISDKKIDYSLFHKDSLLKYDTDLGTEKCYGINPRTRQAQVTHSYNDLAHKLRLLEVFFPM